jgi:hypothetical protein
MAAEFTESGKISVAGVCDCCPNCFFSSLAFILRRTIVSVRAIPVIVIELRDIVTEEGINRSRDVS